eukprot:scaffold2321_cov329-Prasinococcus_capsulatus_cf.AAC.1
MNVVADAPSRARARDLSLPRSFARPARAAQERGARRPPRATALAALASSSSPRRRRGARARRVRAAGRAERDADEEGRALHRAGDEG